MQELEVGVWVQCLRLRDRVLLSEFRVKGSGLQCAPPKQRICGGHVGCSMMSTLGVRRHQKGRSLPCEGRLHLAAVKDLRLSNHSGYSN